MDAKQFTLKCPDTQEVFGLTTIYGGDAARLPQLVEDAAGPQEELVSGNCEVRWAELSRCCTQSTKKAAISMRATFSLRRGEKEFRAQSG
jgi:hypothetical protein